MRPAGERRGKRLDVNEVASVGSYLLVCLVGSLVFSVMVWFLFCRRLNRGSVAREPHQRRPLRQVLDGYRGPIFR